ncbi:hypothetical protein BC830DRAFT_1126565 [Chytriomyces sp. MP71]|nr:hypothetical protein BC830DRAFT_1126565 [Chytriomyces sp. MP71]
MSSSASRFRMGILLSPLFRLASVSAKPPNPAAALPMSLVTKRDMGGIEDISCPIRNASFARRLLVNRPSRKPPTLRTSATRTRERMVATQTV